MKDWLDEEMEREGIKHRRSEAARLREEHAASCDAEELRWQHRREFGAERLKAEHLREHQHANDNGRPAQRGNNLAQEVRQAAAARDEEAQKGAAAKQKGLLWVVGMIFFVTYLLGAIASVFE